ncbi:MAG: hypothetical protein R6V27_01935 [Balneolaceae bacterium]
MVKIITLTFIIPFLFNILGSSPSEFQDSNITVIQVCDAENIMNTTTTESIQTCKGEYRYCGNDVFKCLRVEGGLFACCDLPGYCPPVGGGPDPLPIPDPDN